MDACLIFLYLGGGRGTYSIHKYIADILGKPPTTIYLWLISLTASKELPILLLKLLECMEQLVFRIHPWTSRP